MVMYEILKKMHRKCKSSVTTLHFLSTVLSSPKKKFLQKLSRCEKNDKFWLVGTKNCENLRGIQFNIKISEVRSENPLFEIEVASECCFIKFLQKIGSCVGRFPVKGWCFFGFQRVFWSKYQRIFSVLTKQIKLHWFISDDLKMN